MLVYLVASLLVCLSEFAGAQQYGSQSRPPQYSPQQQNSQAWRQWYYQRRQQQQQRENSSRGRHNTPIASPAANSYYPNRYNQQQYSGNSQPYYQQGQYPQQQYSGYRQPGYADYRQPNYQPAPPPMTPPPPVTPAVPVEVEFEMEVPTTTTTLRPQSMYNSWGQYNQGYGSNGYYGSQYQQEPAPAYQGGQYQPQPQSSGYGSYYQQPSAAQQQQPHQQQQPQPQPQQQQQPSGQSSFSQPPPSPQQQGQQGVFGIELPQPVEMANQFPGKFDMSALKPTVFNQNYQGSSAAGSSTGTGQGEALGQTGQNPNAPPGKVDFGSKGPNPIQLNQFLAQPNAPKDSNALDALLGTLLTGTVAAQGNSKPLAPTTRAPPPSPQTGLVSNRLDGFVLGPKSEFRSNMFSEIPVNNEAYDSLNPLAGFMGETPPPPVTTTPLPPGRNGDFLEGFIGVSNAGTQPAKAAAAENAGPNIYFYNYMNDNTAATTPGPAHPLSEQALNSMPTQDLSSVVQKLLGVLATKQGQGTTASQG